MAIKISKLLPDVFPKNHRWKLELLQHWDSIIGNLKDKVRIEKIENNLLVLGVCHPSWGQELFFFSDVLRSRINRLFKEEKITKIRFKTVVLGAKRRPQCLLKSKQKRAKVASKKRTRMIPSNSEKQLSKISNKEFREVLRQYYVRCFEQDKRR